MSRLAVQTLRNLAPILVGAVLFAMGLYALLHLLKPVHFSDIVAQVRAMPAPVLAGAGLATVAAYAALVAYDWFALRYIGKTLSWPVVTIGGFLGYAFGNTVGVSVISGGAVRYRIYSAAGLNAFEVAAVSGYIALALGTGLTLIGLAALAIHPGAVAAYLPYGQGVVQLIALALVLSSVGLIAWLSVSQRTFRFRAFQLHMPPPRDLLGQLIATLVDVAAAAFALWVLLPAGKPDFATFIAVYSAAMMIGVLSHVPGGVGVFETVVIGTLPADVPVSDAAAALLMFRLIYYLIPFALGFLIVALNEVRLAGGALSRYFGRLQGAQPALSTLHGLSPGLVAAVAFGFGVYLLLVSMVPAVQQDAIAERELVATLLREGGTIALTVAGVSLLILSHGLARRVSSAFWLAVAALAAGAVAALLNDADVKNATLLCVGALALLPFRRAFDRPGHLTSDVFELRWFLAVGGTLATIAAFFFFAHKSSPTSDAIWVGFNAISETQRALRAGLIASSVLLVFGVYLFTRPVRLKPAVDADGDALALAAGIVERSETPLAWLSQTGDKRFLFSDSGRSFLMYAVQGRSWVAYGNPVGDIREFEPLCWSFAEQAAKSGCHPVMYEVQPLDTPLCEGLGLTLNRIGEEAVIQLAGFDASAPALAAFTGEAPVEVLLPPHSADTLAALRSVSDVWLSGRDGAEKQFSVGRFSDAYMNLFPIAVLREAGQIVAFANLMFTQGGRYGAVDLIRFLPDQGREVLGRLFLGLITYCKANGTQEISLGMVPLAGLSSRSVAHSWDRFGRLIYRHGGAFEDFEDLRTFKSAFQPDWRPRYLALPAKVSLLTAMRDVAILIAGTDSGLSGK
ncbi:bifunctional lysylphosphatidylglycerol flippase/synthetase MprF [Thalassobius vesicularis]|uniref:bifunctional lysylphosphatidylglycerol flippase/synthetase MprF n=1 Tax=Thalassobius vesicularis TaxID=1294297 RepID=UPI001454C8F3|nr:bifunctional lysylphosphatidylglycerol flippase/synthetase MprF [Thalassobius vesicularis]